jgi:hypothetical protein
MRQANRLAAQLGLGPLDDCGASRTRLAGATTVTVVATDFAFAVAPLRHGPTHFVVRNRGQQPHQLFVVGLRAAGTLDEALAADRENGDPGPFLADAGAVSHVVPPGGRTWLDVDLARGPTALLCFLPLPDATPHAYKGMAVEIDVR